MSSSPFISSMHGHPNFNPVKVGKNAPPMDVAKNSKQPKPPDKPLMPYMRYSKKVWDDVKARYPDLKIWEISRIVGQMWRDLPDEQKQSYIDAFEMEKNEYNDSLKVYHNSPAYQSWISSLKSKEHEERETHKRKEKKSGNHGINSPQKGDGRVSVQTLDSDFDHEDDYISMKHLAAARFYRNHKLITEILSDTMVPDVRNVVTNSRLQVLRNQVESLKVHQKKLDEELRVLEDKFHSKKRSIEESSEMFNKELVKRFTSLPMETRLRKMTETAFEQFRNQHQRMQQQLQQQQQQINTNAAKNGSNVIEQPTTTSASEQQTKQGTNEIPSAQISNKNTWPRSSE